MPCDDATKQLRHKVHDQLDSLWCTTEQRDVVYRVVAKRMGQAPEECHVARFGLSRCEQMLEVLRTM